jgi:allantoicase
MPDTASTTAADVDPESAVTDLGQSLGQDQQHQQQTTVIVRSQLRPNYLSAQRGARILFATDEWFAAADNLLKDDDAVFDPDAFCIEGKVMDGWETRRRRQVGHDFCIVQLAAPLVAIDEILIDTGYFTGNFVPAVSIQAYGFAVMDDDDEAVTFVQKVPGALSRLVRAAASSSYQGTAATAAEIALADAATATWETIVPVTPLRAGYEETRYHSVYPDTTSRTDTSSNRSAMTHLRINIFPDGGIARIRVYGRPVEPVSLPRCLYPPDLPYAVSHGNSSTVLPSQTLRLQQQRGDSSELTELSLGGQGIDCSNQHYGSPVKLLQASYGKDMGDGWETARHLNRPARLVALAGGGGANDPDQDLVDFGDLRDWCTFSLGTPAKTIRSIIVDTKHFRGNYPESVIIEGRNHGDGDADHAWDTLVPRSRLAPDAEHLFQLAAATDADRRTTRAIRVTIFPDGGVSRVRVYGEPLLIE